MGRAGGGAGRYSGPFGGGLALRSACHGSVLGEGEGAEGKAEPRGIHRGESIGRSLESCQSRGGR
jgi:hypothetical protein